MRLTREQTELVEKEREKFVHLLHDKFQKIHEDLAIAKKQGQSEKVRLLKKQFPLVEQDLQFATKSSTEEFLRKEPKFEKRVQEHFADIRPQRSAGKVIFGLILALVALRLSSTITDETFAVIGLFLLVAFIIYKIASYKHAPLAVVRA